MNEVIYKIRVNRPCRLFIDDEEMMILGENKLTKITLPEGEYLRKVVAIDNKAIYDEAEITLSGSSKLDTITLDTTGLEEAKRNALPKDKFQVGDLMYKALEDGSGVAVAKYVDKNITEIIIPEEIVFGHYIYEVKEIGEWAFWYCKSLTSVIIPNSVTSIGNSAFSNCSGLTSIKIPNSVTSIGWNAFAGCIGLTSIIIPNSVTSIGDYAFYGCYGLTSIRVEDGNTKYDSRENCNAIIETATNTLISGCQNTIIPNSVTSIGRSTFSGCSGLTSIIIPNSVMSIGDGAFYGCFGLTSIRVEDGNTKYDSRDNCNAIIETATNTLISGCQNTIIPNSVTSIGERAFSGCSSLTSLTIPNSVTSIGWGAFSNCSGLTSITIPNSVTSIGNAAFYDCSSLTSVTIGNSVTSIGWQAFYGCTSLTSVIIPNSVTSIGSGAFPEHTQIIRK